VARVERGRAGAHLTLETPRALPRLVLGESIAVDGACLTVTAKQGRRFRVDVSPETLRRTTLGRLAKDARVNLERALRVGDRLGGHVVLGHVDGVGTLEKVEPDGDWLLYRFRAPGALLPFLVEKGSIAVDGVSLTVVSAGDASFTVSLIPATLELTTLGRKGSGDPVNIEVDVLAKYVERLLAKGTSA